MTSTASASTAPAPLHRLAYAGVLPEVQGAPQAAWPGHVLVGRVTLGPDAWLGAGSVIRADGHFVRIGRGFGLGRGATVHIAHDRYPTIVGDGVLVGANAVIHACTVGDGCVVEEDCVVLDGSEVAADAVLEAGSIVFPRSRLEGGWLYAGRPARPLRRLEDGERETRAAALRRRIEAADATWPPGGIAASAQADAFVADTAVLQGRVELAAGSSVWFGCRLDARGAAIVVGARCNVQDNSVLVAAGRALVLGEGTTVGHNVELADCSVGARCLVGMGSRIAPGTVIEDDTFVAAGCVTEPGQVLEGGRLWGGQPARPLGELDDTKRLIVQMTAVVYAEYARQLRGG